jgi:hypothetical protein
MGLIMMGLNLLKNLTDPAVMKKHRNAIGRSGLSGIDPNYKSDSDAHGVESSIRVLESVVV